MYNNALNTNTTLHLGNSASTIFILKLYKDCSIGTIKLPIHITLITHCQSTRESAITINNRKHSIKDNKHELNTMTHSQNSNKSTSRVPQG